MFHVEHCIDKKSAPIRNGGQNEMIIDLDPSTIQRWLGLVSHWAYSPRVNLDRQFLDDAVGCGNTLPLGGYACCILGRHDSTEPYSEKLSFCHEFGNHRCILLAGFHSS